MLLMESELPITNTVSFKQDQDTKETDWNTPIVGKEEPRKYLPYNIFGYRVPCHTDSGSGQIIYANAGAWKIEPRHVIAALQTKAYHETFSDSNGELVEMPCGAYSYDDTNNKVLENNPVSQSLSYPYIFDWIKEHLQK